MRIINCKIYARTVLCLSGNLFNQNVVEYRIKCIKMHGDSAEARYV
jgi:hypothetical protein